MARSVRRLSARAVETLKTPGRHADGDGLYLVVDASGARRWLFLFRWQGKLKEMGLGSARTVPLARARQLAREAGQMVAEGANPIAARQAERAEVEEAPRFGAFAMALCDDLEHGFRNDKHKAQWRMTLTRYAAPLTDLSLEEIGTAQVLAVLKPIWQTKPETASRLRGRIERVLDAARARGWRSGENAARWRGHLDALLPPRGKLSRGHHATLPYGEAPEFMTQLRATEAMSALALEFCILTAARSGEVLNAHWAEIDREAGVWTVPAARMKAGREHRVPLSAPALVLIGRLAEARTGDFVFAGQRPGRPLSVMAMTMVLRRMKRDDITVHGFRSTFRDWAAEETDFPREIAEAALAHVVGDSTERAYRRGDALEKRRALMEAWGAFVGGAGCAPDAI